VKKIIKILGAVAILGTATMASDVTNSIVTVETLNTNKVNIISTDTSWYCDVLERLMGMCRTSQPLPFEN